MDNTATRSNQTNSNIKVQYRKRVPTPLVNLIGRKYIKRTVTQTQAIELDETIRKCRVLIEVGAHEVALQELRAKGLVSDDKIHIIDDKKLSKVVNTYLINLASDTLEYDNQSYFFNVMVPVLIPNDPDLKDIPFQQLLKIKKIVQTLPKRNIQKYRVMPFADVVGSQVPETDRVSITTANKYLKWLKSLFSFAYKRGLIEKNTAEALDLIPNKQNARLQRKAFTPEGLALFFDTYKGSPQCLIIKALYLSGLRRSELFKAEIEEVDGVCVFNLKGASSLKTLSSYRLIPINSTLIPQIAELKQAIESYRHNEQYISKWFSKQQNEGTLHGLRHTFATMLIQKGADSNIVSELMGHSHQTMTLSRYAKGYSIGQLKEVVELL